MKPIDELEPEPAGERLDSWKEIAAYLKRDARTVRRWEKSEGLPIHRHQHSARPTVYAFRHEIDAWWNNRKPALEADTPTSRVEPGWTRSVGAIVLIGLLLALSFYFLPARTGEIAQRAEPPGPAVVRRVLEHPDLMRGCNLRTVAPDGRLLGCFTDEGKVAVIDLVTMSNRELTELGAGFPAYGPVFHPSGEELVYTHANATTRVFDLVIAGLDGTTRTLYRGDDVVVEPLAWSRDGNTVAATFWHSDQTREIVVIDARDGSVRHVRRFEGAFPTDMSFSPDGRSIAYALPPTPDSARDVLMVAVDGGAQTHLTDHQAEDRFPVWLPDGSGLFFLSNRTGTVDGWVLPMENGRPAGPPQVLQRELGNIDPISLSDNGDLYYRLQVGLVDAYVVDVDLETGAVLAEPAPVITDVSGTNMQYTWSRDGRHAAFVSRRAWSPWWVLVVRDLELGTERIIDTMRYVRRPEFSPDGERLLVRGTDRHGRSGTFELDPETGALVQEAVRGITRRARWSGDDEVLYHEDDRRLGSTRLVRRDFVENVDVEVFSTPPPASLRRFRVSRDGRFVAFVVHNPAESTRALMLIPSSGGEAIELERIPGEERMSVEDFSADGRFVVFTTAQADEEPRLFRVSIEDRDVRELVIEAEGLRDVSVHPDGTRLSFTAGWPVFDVYVMQNAVPREHLIDP